MINAASLMKLEIPVFPCNSDKSPRCKGDWRKYKGPVDAEVFGIPVPDGLIILDLDYHKGLDRKDVERLLGCNPGDLAWNEAELQTTMNGGRHYCFRVDGVMKQGSDIHGLKGFDTRVAGKGYIASGAGYKQCGAGIARLAYADTFPTLPLPAQRSLRPIDHDTPARLSVADGTEPFDVDRATAMLKAIPPDCNRDTWMRIGLSMKSGGLPFELFDEWSMGGLHGGIVPTNYQGTAVTRHQYDSFKAAGKTSISTLRFIAAQHGWQEDWSKVFGGGGDERGMKQVIDDIIECGADPVQIATIVRQIRDTPLGDLEKQIALSTLKSELKSAGLLTKGLRHAIQTAIKDPTARASHQEVPPPDRLPEYLTFPELADKGYTISGASSNHGNNATEVMKHILQARYVKDGDKYRWWDGTHWARVDEFELDKLLCMALLPDHCMQSTVTGTKWAIHRLTGAIEPPYNSRVVYFRNGALDSLRGTTFEHNRSHYNRSRLDIDYDAEARCPQFMQFVQSIFGGLEDGNERVMLLQEIMGYALIDDTMNLQKAIALCGASRGGKSVVLEVLQALRGDGNYGVFSLSGLQDIKHQNGFIGQSLQIDTDAKSCARRDQVKATEFFNKVVSNEKVSIPILYERAPFYDRTNSKIIIACNALPELRDDSGATSNRWVILKFDRTFYGKEDRGLVERLTEQRELQGIATWAVHGLRRLIGNCGMFTTPESSIEELEELRELNSPLVAFFADSVRAGPDERCHSRELYDAYRQWAMSEGLFVMSHSEFTRTVRQMEANLRIKYKRNLKVGESNRAGYMGCAPRNASATQQAFGG
jgi:P4 family phage/plasmid primase-like protien